MKKHLSTGCTRTLGRFLSTSGAALALIASGCDRSSRASEPAAVLDVSQSDIRVSSPTVSSGSSVNVTLTTRDTRGRPLTRGGRVVQLAASGGSSRGAMSASTDRGDGTYTAVFTGRVAGSPTTITATIDGAPVTHPLPTVGVRPGAFSPSVSYVTVTPQTILKDGRALLELVTVDSVGNLLDTGGHRVRFGASGGSGSGTVGPVTDHGNGRYSAPFTGAEVGTPLVVSTVVNDVPLTGPPPTVTVARGLSAELSRLSVSSDSIAVHGGVRVTLQARDSADIARTSGGDTVRFLVVRSGSDGDGTLNEVSDHGDGTYSATFTATAWGTPVAMGATLNGRRKGGHLPSVTILPIPATAQQSSVSVSAATLPAGQSATFTVLLRDLRGDAVTSGGHSVRFTLGAGGSSNGVLGEPVDRGNGRYTSNFRGLTAGSPVIVGATIDDSIRIEMLDSLGVSHLPEITVTAGPASVDSTEARATPAEVNVGDTATIRVQARDAFGNALSSGGRRITLARSGGAGVSVGRLGAVTDHGNGSYSASYFADSSGTPDTVFASMDGARLRSPAPIITVGNACTAGPRSLERSRLTINDTTRAQRPTNEVILPSGVTTTLTLRVRDERDCPVPGAHAVAYSVSTGGSSGILGATTMQGRGVYVATFTGQLAGAASTITATIDSERITSSPVTVTVVPGDVSAKASEFTTSHTAMAVGDTARMVLTSRDDAGNALVKGGRTVEFVIVGDDGHRSNRAAVDHGNGRYSATLIGRKGGVVETVEARIDGTPLSARAIVHITTP